MVGWSLSFMAAALVAGSFAYGYGRTTALALGMAKALFFVFAALALVSMMSGNALGY